MTAGGNPVSGQCYQTGWTVTARRHMQRGCGAWLPQTGVDSDLRAFQIRPLHCTPSAEPFRGTTTYPPPLPHVARSTTMRAKLVGIVLLVLAVAGARTAGRGSDRFTDVPGTKTGGTER